MKIGIMFSGYGNQFVGMGKELYDEFRIVQEYFEQASNCLDVNFVKLCFASSDADLKVLPNSYTTPFLTSVATYALLKEMNIRPHLVAGYNIGLYAALYASGSMSLPDGLYLINKHALFYKDLLEKVSVKAWKISSVDTRELERMCKKINSVQDEQLFIASYESTQATIMVGSEKALLLLKKELAPLRGVTIKSVDRGAGLYCTLMHPVINSISMYLEKVDFKDAVIPLIATDRAKQIMSSNDIKNFFLAQLKSPILWSSSMELMTGYDLVIEVGPGKQLSSVLNQRYPEMQIVSVNTKADLEQLRMIIGE